MTTAQQAEIEHLASQAEVAVGGGLRTLEVAAVVVTGLLVCPPLAILVVFLVVPLLVIAVALGLLGAALATPYVLVRHFHGHPGGHLASLKHRLGRAGRALLDLAPHRRAPAWIRQLSHQILGSPPRRDLRAARRTSR